MELTPEEREMVKKHRQEKAAAQFKFKEYTDHERIEAFHKLYAMAYEHYDIVRKGGYRDDDTKQWFFEAMMELLGKDVWKSYNAMV